MSVRRVQIINLYLGPPAPEDRGAPDPRERKPANPNRKDPERRDREPALRYAPGGAAFVA